MAAVFNLNHHSSYISWHFFQMSVSNVLVIACMFIVFFAAILIRFPSHGVTDAVSDRRDDAPKGELGGSRPEADREKS